MLRIRTRRAWPLLITLIALTTSACGELIGPGPLDDTYVLASIDGAGPPLVLLDHTSETGRDVMSFVYDSLLFRPDGTVRRSFMRERVITDSGGAVTGPLRGGESYQGTYERRGSVITITRPTIGWDLGGTETLYVTGSGLQREFRFRAECVGCPEVNVVVFDYRR